MRPLSHRLGPAAALAGAFFAAASLTSAQPRELKIEIVSRRYLEIPGSRPQAVQRGPAGEILLLAPKQRLLHRLLPHPASPSTHLLDTAFPELKRPGACIFQGFDVDGAGRALLPAMWPGSTNRPVSAVLVLGPDGERGRAVVLTPPVELRHVAAGADGTFYVLGLNAGYFRGLEKECTMVHKYSPAGERLASFSSCPETPRSASLSSVVHRLNKDIDLGHLWTKGDLVYHVLPFSRELRVFRSDGTLVRRVKLQPPAENPLPARYSTFGGDTVSQQVWRIAPVGEGNLLVHWVYSQPEGPGRRNLPYLALHNAAGVAISQPKLLPWKHSALAFSDGQGYCYFIRWISPVRHELIRTKIYLQ